MSEVGKYGLRKNQVVFVGRRINNGKLQQVFLSGNDDKSFYSGIKYVILGNKYVQNKNGNMKVVPEDLGPAEYDDEQLRLWEAEELAAKEMDARRRASKRRDLSKFNGMTLKQLMTVCEKLPYSERDYFAQAMKTKILFGLES